jgi:hypothetical protein
VNRQLAHAPFRRGPVRVTRPGRPTVTGRLLYLSDGKAKVTLPSGAVIGVPAESLTLLPEPRTP